MAGLTQPLPAIQPRLTTTPACPTARRIFMLSPQFNPGGENPTNSPEVSTTVPIPPPPSPSIGWFDYEGVNPALTVFHPVSGTPYIAHNDLMLAIMANAERGFDPIHRHRHQSDHERGHATALSKFLSELSDSFAGDHCPRPALIRSEHQRWRLQCGCPRRVPVSSRHSNDCRI